MVKPLKSSWRWRTQNSSALAQSMLVPLVSVVRRYPTLLNQTNAIIEADNGIPSSAKSSSLTA